MDEDECITKHNIELRVRENAKKKTTLIKRMWHMKHTKSFGRTNKSQEIAVSITRLVCHISFAIGFSICAHVSLVFYNANYNFD